MEDFFYNIFDFFNNLNEDYYFLPFIIIPILFARKGLSIMETKDIYIFKIGCLRGIKEVAAEGYVKRAYKERYIIFNHNQKRPVKGKIRVEHICDSCGGKIIYIIKSFNRIRTEIYIWLIISILFTGLFALIIALEENSFIGGIIWVIIMIISCYKSILFGFRVKNKEQHLLFDVNNEKVTDL